MPHPRLTTKKAPAKPQQATEREVPARTLRLIKSQCPSQPHDEIEPVKVERRTRTLYVDQAYDIMNFTSGSLLKNMRSVLFNKPMGSGKSTVILGIAAKIVGTVPGFILTAPRNDILDQFKRTIEETSHFIFPANAGMKFPRIKVPLGLFKMTRENNQSTVSIASYIRRVVEQWKQGDGGEDFGFATTHAALCLLMKHINDEGHPYYLPPDINLFGMVLFADELHRAGAFDLNILSKFINWWIAHNGRVVGATATPFDADAVPVRFEKMDMLTLPVDEHMARKGMPWNLVCATVTVPVPIDLEDPEGYTAGDLYGERARPDVVRAVGAAMVACAQADEVDYIDDEGKPAKHRPVTLIYVRPKDSMKTPLISAIIAEEFERIGYRVFNACGEGEEKAEEFIRKLREESALPYKQRTIDVVIGSERVCDGADIVKCSHVFTYGFVGSSCRWSQLFGRAWRPKEELDPSHPKYHPYYDCAKMIAFVPVPDQDLQTVVQDSLKTAISKRGSVDVLVNISLMSGMATGFGYKTRKLIVDKYEKTLREDGASEEEIHHKTQELNSAFPRIEQMAPHLAEIVPILEGSDGDAQPWIDTAMGKTEEVYESRNQVHPGKYSLLALAAEDTEVNHRELIEEMLRRVERGARKKFGSALLQEIVDGVLPEFQSETVRCTKLAEHMNVQSHAVTGVSVSENRRKFARDGITVTYAKLQAVVQEKGIKEEAEYRLRFHEITSTKGFEIAPENPDLAYRDCGWISWAYFLGKSVRRCTLTREALRSACQRLDITTKQAYAERWQEIDDAGPYPEHDYDHFEWSQILRPTPFSVSSVPSYYTKIDRIRAYLNYMPGATRNEICVATGLTEKTVTDYRADANTRRGHFTVNDLGEWFTVENPQRVKDDVDINDDEKVWAAFRTLRESHPEGFGADLVATHSGRRNAGSLLYSMRLRGIVMQLRERGADALYIVRPDWDGVTKDYRR